MARTKLSQAQQGVINIMKQTSKPLLYVKGGFWTYEGCRTLGTGYPLWSTTIQTIRSLVKLGWLRLDDSLPIDQQRATLAPGLQRLIYIKDWETNRGPGCPNKARPIALDREPAKIATLFHDGGENEPPKLPILPEHNRNAFLEDKHHDWVWRNGFLHYFSRVVDRPIWILLEYNP